MNPACINCSSLCISKSACSQHQTSRHSKWKVSTRQTHSQNKRTTEVSLSIRSIRVCHTCVGKSRTVSPVHVTYKWEIYSRGQNHFPSSGTLEVEGNGVEETRGKWGPFPTFSQKSDVKGKRKGSENNIPCIQCSGPQGDPPLHPAEPSAFRATSFAPHVSRHEFRTCRFTAQAGNIQRRGYPGETCISVSTQLSCTH